MITYILFAVGFVLLIKGADVLVAGSSSLAKHYKISDMIIGLTVVSFGTSMPELIVNILASVQGNSDIAIGNIFGSNIANILLILGLTAVIMPLPLQKNTILSEIPFSLIATLLVAFLANAALFGESDNLQVSRPDGFILLFFFGMFMAYIVSQARNGDNPIADEGEYNLMPKLKSSLYIGAGVLGLFVGGKWVVDGAVMIANSFGLSESFVGLTIVAVGTSLPELVTSVVAASKKKIDIAVGNVVGSNIFNILWVLGLSAVIKPLQFSSVENTDILMMILGSTLLILSMAIGRRNTIDRWNGIIFILIYLGYLGYLVHRG